MKGRYERFKCYGAGREEINAGMKEIRTSFIHGRSGRKYGLMVRIESDGSWTCNPSWFIAYLKPYKERGCHLDAATVCEAVRDCQDLYLNQ
jgi:hypothetical protein